MAFCAIARVLMGVWFCCSRRCLCTATPSSPTPTARCDWWCRWHPADPATHEGADVVGNSADQAPAMLRAALDQRVEIVKRANIRLDFCELQNTVTPEATIHSFPSPSVPLPAGEGRKNLSPAVNKGTLEAEQQGCE